MKEFVVCALAAANIAEAFVLAALTVPGLEKHAWQKYAANIVKQKKQKSGILVIRRAKRAHICGLVSYHFEFELLAGRVLQAKHLAAIDMLDQKPILLALLDQLGRLAQRSHCNAMRIALPETENGRTPLFEDLLQLRPRLVLKRRCEIDWSMHRPTEPFDLFHD